VIIIPCGIISTTAGAYQLDIISYAATQKKSLFTLHCEGQIIEVRD